MASRSGVVCGILMFVIGCSASTPPVAGGKPVDHWLDAVENTNPKVRVEAIEKLGNIGSKSAAAIDAIVTGLEDSDAKVRKVAIFAVVRNRTSWRQAIPVLKQMSETDDSEEIRKLAKETHQNLTK